MGGEAFYIDNEKLNEEEDETYTSPDDSYENKDSNISKECKDHPYIL